MGKKMFESCRRGGGGGVGTKSVVLVLAWKCFGHAGGRSNIFPPFQQRGWGGGV